MGKRLCRNTVEVKNIHKRGNNLNGNIVCRGNIQNGNFQGKYVVDKKLLLRKKTNCKKALGKGEVFTGDTLFRWEENEVRNTLKQNISVRRRILIKEERL